MDAKPVIKQELRDTCDDEFSYDGEIGSIGAVAIGEYSVKVEHFVIKRDERRNGYGSRLFESLLEVLRDNNYTSVTVKIQSIQEEGKQDPVMDFLREYGFRYQDSFDHHNWGQSPTAEAVGLPVDIQSSEKWLAPLSSTDKTPDIKAS